MKQLKKRGYHLASICPFCGREEESLERLLVHCHNIWSIWADFFSVFGAFWTCPFRINDVLCSWVNFPIRKDDSVMEGSPY